MSPKFILILLFQFLIFQSLSQSYVVASNKLTWADSNSFCKDIGSHLASIHSDADSIEMIEARALCEGYNGCWIGLNDNNTEGFWEWNDESITDYGLRITTTPFRQEENIHGHIMSQIVMVMKIVLI